MEKYSNRQHVHGSIEVIWILYESLKLNPIYFYCIGSVVELQHP